MPWLSQWFWLFCGLWCGVVGSINVWFKLRKQVAAGTISRQQALAFTRGMALWILVPCLLLCGLQWSIGGEASPDYPTWPVPQRYAAFALQAFVWAALLYWVFVRDGASTLSRLIGKTRWTPRFLTSPTAMKLLAVVVVVSGVVALFAAPR